MIIAREIRVFLVVLFIIAISAKMYLGWYAAFFVLSIIIPLAFIFRDPVCHVPSAPLAIVSPVNGEIISIGKVVDKWIDRDAIKIRIKMKFWHTHILRSPIEGKVKNQWAAYGEETGVKKRYTYWIQTDENDDVIYSVATGKFSPFMEIKLRCGERTGQGQKSGFLYFSGIIDVLIPEQTRMDLAVGDMVKSGSSVLAQMIHNDSPAI
jgi:phosphatidylserine decarboxylase